MKTEKNIFYILLSFLLLLSISCTDEFLEFTPEDRMTSADFPENEEDVQYLLNAVYARLRTDRVYPEGFLAFGITDAMTPNAYLWGTNRAINKVGRGAATSSDDQIITYLWNCSYSIIFRANYLIEALEEVSLENEAKSMYSGEAHFLRGLAYSILADAYGGVPIITTSFLPSEEARSIPRASLEDTWNQVITDYDVAIDNLDVDAPMIGRATKGAALAMKMRAYLYQNKYEEVLETAEQIEALGKYALFPTYDGLFKLENENNVEVIFDVQYIRGENSQGSWHDQYCGTGTGTWQRGTAYVPTEDLINEYERIDGSPGSYLNSEIDLDNPYEGWDPRLKTTAIVPGSYYMGYRFPDYLYPGGAFNHPANRIKHLSGRKYRIEPESESDLPPAGESNLNYIVIRYADVILSKAEALIETGGSTDEAVALINKIRTERNDVKLQPLSSNLTIEQAREKLRHERRIEFALEGLYWSDIRRWNIGKDVYPQEIRDQNGDLIETRFPEGYLDAYQYLPVPEGERALNENLEQNPGW